MLKKTVLVLVALPLASCSVFSPSADYVGCQAHVLQWAFGPSEDQAYIDVCYTQLNIAELSRYYSFVPIQGSNPDTRQVIDANRDGIADGIRRNGRIHGNNIYWGDRCAVSALRVLQKGCRNLGNRSRTGGCDWIAIHIKAKPGVRNHKVELTPIWHVRLPDGSERDIEAKTMSTGFKQCN